MRYLWVNQGWRPAWILAELDNQALVEYKMPNQATALQILSTLGTDIKEDNVDPWLCNGRSVGYNSLPLKWLRELVRTEEPWYGYPRRGRTPGTPREELERRTK